MSKKAERCKHEDGCDKKAIGNGWCRMHYMRIERHGEPGPAGEVSPGRQAFLTVCKIDGCGKKALAKDLCRKHYMRVVRTGISDDPEPTQEFCGIEGCGRQHHSIGLCRLHYWRKSVTGDVGPVQARDRKRVEIGKDGKVCCNTCFIKKRLDDFPGRKDGRLFGSCKQCRQKKNQMRRYGLCINDGDKCAICESTKKLHVDHDHKTGTARGVLCGLCNIGLGHFRDDKALLIKAVAYLGA